MEVQAFVVTIRDVAAPGNRGLLRPLLRRYLARRCSYAVFALPAVQAVILYKWRQFGKPMLLAQLAWFLLWLIAFNIFTVRGHAGAGVGEWGGGRWPGPCSV